MKNAVVFDSPTVQTVHKMTAEIHMPLTRVEDQVLTDLFLNQPLGSKPHIEWVKELCPQVVAHYKKFPSFKEFVNDDRELPIGTTDFLARSVCTLSIVQQLASSIEATLHLFAGSHLGALLHGQPIAWDDDSDAALPVWSLKPFLEACNIAAQVNSTTKVRCIKVWNAVKVYIEYEGMENYILDEKKKWKSPYIDLFFYDILLDKNGNRTVLQEVAPDGKRHEKRDGKYHAKKSFDVRDYFPVQPFYFAGLYVMGANPSIAKKRYRWNSCMLSNYNHRFEMKSNKGIMELDCHRLAQAFPFTYTDGTMRCGNGTVSISILPTTASNDIIMSEIPLKQRMAWANSSEEFGPNLTSLVPHLNTVEVDNSISTDANSCNDNGPNITVIEFNTERGARWLEAINFLKGANADVIILNEMDIGMARTDQQHTTKLMAQMLKMNYAWGLEFVELTNGNKKEQDRFGRIPNFHGLHGNAILTRCPISDPVIFRDPVGQF
jgi:hypothetical protein